jgi:predicted nucleotidyltransferase component of viral defense system
MSAKNMAASVATRLLNRARARNEDYQFLLTRYALERLMWRLAQSQYSDAFVLKGAMVFLVWTGEVYRPTKDLDLLAQSTQTAEHLRAVFAEICNIEVEDDGLVFVADSIEAGQIRDDQTYGGVRLTMRSLLGKMRIPVQIDVGFGDAVTPAAAKSVFPVLLEHSSAPLLRVYPKEASIAEKLDAVVCPWEWRTAG